MKTLRERTVRFVGGPLDRTLGKIPPSAWKRGFTIHEYTGPDGEDWMCGYFLTGVGSDGIEVYVAGGHEGLEPA